MAIPTALTEGAGDKMLPLVYDNAGTNAAAVWRSVVTRTINGSPLGHVGVGTHPDAATWTAADPIVVMGGVDNTVVRKLAVDASGRLVGRPAGIYDAGGGNNAYGHARLVAGTAVNGEQYGWQGVATHQDGVAGFTAPQGIVVIGGYDGANVRKLLSDTVGRVRTYEDYTLAGQGHLNVVAGTATALRAASTPFRKIRIIADGDNAVPVFLGVAGVTADETGATGGYQLRANVDVEWSGAGNLNAVFINGTSALAGVSFLYWT